jgi:K+ transporter
MNQDKILVSDLGKYGISLVYTTWSSFEMVILTTPNNVAGQHTLVIRNTKLGNTVFAYHHNG